MRFLSKKVLTSAVLALVFSVAVSGGCGGGGGGHYSGDFGNSGDSSQEITTENVSPDVSPVPAPIPESYDIPVSVDEYGDDDGGDDDYGIGNDEETVTFTDLSMLYNVEWDIESIKIVDTQGYEMPVYQNSFKIDGIQNITLNKLNIFFSVGRLVWSNGIDNPSYTLDLTTDFRPLSSSTGSVSFSTQAAPILRSASKFTEINSNVANSTTKDYRAEIRVTQNGNSVLIGRETIRIAKKFPTYVIIENQFAMNHAVYTSSLRLKASQSNSFFRSINNTTWQVKSIDVAGLVSIGGKTQTDAPVNYPVDKFNFGKITVLTSIDNNGRILNFMDNNGQPINAPLTATFTDNRRSVSNLVAPILRPASNFKSNGFHNTYEVFEANLVQQTNSYPVNELLYITKDGPKGNIVLNNSFYLPDSNNPNQYYFYWVTVYLEPYKPELEPEPERVSEYELFEKLNNTSWVISDINILNKTNKTTEADRIINDSYNFNVNKLTLQILDGEALLWTDGDGVIHGNPMNPLTINFSDMYGRTFVAPILRSKSGFKYTKEDDGYFQYEASFEDLGTETIYVQPINPLSFIMIDNDFSVSGDGFTRTVDYKIRLELEPYKANKK